MQDVCISNLVCRCVSIISMNIGQVSHLLSHNLCSKYLTELLLMFKTNVLDNRIVKCLETNTIPNKC